MGVSANPNNNQNKRSRNVVKSSSSKRARDDSDSDSYDDSDDDDDDDIQGPSKQKRYYALEGPDRAREDVTHMIAQGNPFETHGPELPEYLKPASREYSQLLANYIQMHGIPSESKTKELMNAWKQQERWKPNK